MEPQHIEIRPLDVRRERSRQALLDAAARADVPLLSPVALCATANVSRTTFLSHFADLPDLVAFVVLRSCDLARMETSDFTGHGKHAASPPAPLLPYGRLFASVTQQSSGDVRDRLQRRLRARRQLTRARVEGAMQLIRRVAASDSPSFA